MTSVGRDVPLYEGASGGKWHWKETWKIITLQAIHSTAGNNAEVPVIKKNWLEIYERTYKFIGLRL